MLDDLTLKKLKYLNLSFRWIDENFVTIKELNGYYDEAVANKTIIDHAPLFFISNYIKNNKIDKNNLMLLIDFIDNEIESFCKKEVFIFLVESESITLEALQSTILLSICENYNIDRILNIRIFHHKLNSGMDINEDFVSSIIETKNYELQKSLVEKISHDEKLLRKLFQESKNKKIRNISKTYLDKITI